MISSASHDSVSRLVAERSMCFATASDKAFEKIDCMIAILCCQAKNRLYESSQRLIQPRRVRCQRSDNSFSQELTQSSGMKSHMMWVDGDMFFSMLSHRTFEHRAMSPDFRTHFRLFGQTSKATWI